MAAYAAAVSLLNLLEHIHELYQARQPIFLDNQLRQLESLKGKVSFFENYLENYHNEGTKEANALERRIANVCYEAEDIIECHIVDVIRNRSSNENNYFGSGKKFSQPLHKVIEKMDLIKRVVKESKKESIPKDKPPPLSSNPVRSLRSPAPPRNENVVGQGEEFKSIMEKLLGKEPKLRLISVTGMGGIGKTRLATRVYEHPNISSSFDITAWVTISQEYHIQKILFCLLKCMNALPDPDEDEEEEEEEESPKHVNGRKRSTKEYRNLGQILHQHLWKRRYLIVLDDMWSVKAWEELQIYLPDESNHSRVLITTRLLNLANDLDSINHVKMNLLGENESWNLLCKSVFVEKSCPPEFEEIGRKIAINCKGLPLAINVIGGLLAKSKMMLQQWEDMSRNTSKNATSVGKNNCSTILSLSYHHLPIHLKPCILYMGVFPEDHEIRVSRLIKLWVAEGFLKPIPCKTLEEEAEDYLRDLIDRNLVFVSKLGSCGNIKTCKIHDLVRDLCLLEAGKCRFIGATKDQGPNQRRIGLHYKSRGEIYSSPGIKLAPFLRSIVCNVGDFLYSDAEVSMPELNQYCKLLRVLDVPQLCPPEDIFQLVNLRHIDLLYPSREPDYTYYSYQDGDYPPPYYGWDSFDPKITLSLFWNIQTLSLHSHFSEDYIVPSIIWEMPQLRHLIVDEFFWLPDPPSRENNQDVVVLENLQTLMAVTMRCTQEILERIPNIKKLKFMIPEVSEFSHYCLDNLVRLNKLQSLKINFKAKFKFLMFWSHSKDVLLNFNFPLSLKKLTLTSCPTTWDDIGTLIGELPHLEYLKLDFCSSEDQWNPVEGQFNNLKVLKVIHSSPKYWNIESYHFPCLEQLVLYRVAEFQLKEIPPGIGDIPTLRSIHISWCSPSIIASAKEILKEQRNLGNEDLHLKLEDRYYDGSDNDEE